MKNKLFLLCLMVFTMAACQSKPGSEKESEATASEETVNSDSGNEAKGRYALKSGVVVYKTQMMGMDAKQTLSFDDYGKLELTEVTMEVMGTKVHTATLTRDGFIYQLDMVQKTGTKTAFNPANNPNIDFENLSEEMQKKMNLKKEGKEDFLGKSCEKMTIDYTDMQMKGNFLVYKGVALKMSTDMGGMKIDMAAESFDENPSFPAGKFDLPADITITGN